MRVELPPVESDANKYSRGSLLIVAGSARFPGAAILAALASERSGSGYTTLAVPTSVVAVAQGHLLSVPVIGAAESQGGFAGHALPGILLGMTHVDAVLCGPGLTVGAETACLLESLLGQAAIAGWPLALDADALNLLSWPGSDGHPLWLKLPANAVLTPHAGELERLLVATGSADAAALAARLGCVIVAKGPTTTVYPADSDEKPYHYVEGTPALSKAGTGDVLAGIIASLLAQGIMHSQAALYGVILHGMAGRLAEANGSRRSLTANDIIESLPVAFHEIEGT
jgi:NAD(P)H-hydrate epimerase